MTEQYVSLRLDTEICCKCSMVFGVPADFKRLRREDHTTFYCPAGHGQCYRGESPEEKLRRELNLAKQKEARYEEEAAALKQAVMASAMVAAQERKARVRIEKRTAHGVCPDCNRSFLNVSRHMASKHKPRLEAR